MFPIRRILVIDDDEMMRDLLHALLQLHGYEVSSVDRGEAALETLRNDSGFDLVLTDVQMPGLNGTDLVSALRRAKPAHALFFGMSGSRPDSALRATLDAFLLKPFDAATLQQTIEQARSEAVLGTSTAVPAGAEPLAAAPLHPLDTSIFDSLSSLIPPHQLGDLYELTLKDVAKRLERIEGAVNSGDLRAAQREAHAIKGSCGMVGAAELQSLAAAIEDGTTPNTSAIAQIPSACLRLRRMLDAKLQPV